MADNNELPEAQELLLMMNDLKMSVYYISLKGNETDRTYEFNIVYEVDQPECVSLIFTLQEDIVAGHK